MKRVHNIRLRTIEREAQDAKEQLDQFIQHAGIERKDVDIKVLKDDEGLAIGELWIDRQPIIRKALTHIKENLPQEQQRQIAANPSRYLDLATHCFLRLDKQAYREGQYVLKETGDTMHLRINIAAFPATKENAEPILTELFTENHA